MHGKQNFTNIDKLFHVEGAQFLKLYNVIRKQECLYFSKSAKCVTQIKREEQAGMKLDV